MSNEKTKNEYINPSLGQIDPRELSPHLPVRWADFPVEERPYNTPQEEYVRSPYPLAIKVIRERWQGVFDDTSLKYLRETGELKEHRFRYQDMVAKEAFRTSLAADVDFQKRRIDMEIIDICNMIEDAKARLDCGYEYAPSKDAGPAGYVQRPLAVDSFAKLVDARLKCGDSLARRLGLANDILKITVDVHETLEVRLSRYMQENDDEYAALKRVVEMGALTDGRLPSDLGDAITTENRLDYEAERAIELTNLPRVPTEYVQEIP